MDNKNFERDSNFKQDSNFKWDSWDGHQTATITGRLHHEMVGISINLFFQGIVCSSDASRVVCELFGWFDSILEPS